jgi:hypothetical protein
LMGRALLALTMPIDGWDQDSAFEAIKQAREALTTGYKTPAKDHVGWVGIPPNVKDTYFTIHEVKAQNWRDSGEDAVIADLEEKGLVPKRKPLRPLVEEAIKQLEADNHFYLARELREALEGSGL